MEHKIGEIVTLPDGRKAEVVESPCNCKDCIFKDERMDVCRKYECIRNHRTDHKDIIYMEVK